MISLLATYSNLKASNQAEQLLSSTTYAATDEKVYYVVVECYESLEEAKKALEVLPDFLVAPIYETTVKGKTEYRICVACYTTKAKALAEIKKLKEVLNDRRFGLWKSKGTARCVFCPVAMNGEPMQPLSPQ